MKAYMIATVRVDDPETYRHYSSRTPALIAEAGGRFLVRGGPVETLEGTPFGDRMVIVEFPSMEAGRAFHASPAYREVMRYRLQSSEATFLLAEGVAEGDGAPDDRVVASPGG